ncbi:alkaline phosphatase PhoX [Croceicoccus marinus]|nr:alkaline phosphatase PhoX [Croceicoccus marinus]
MTQIAPMPLDRRRFLAATSAFAGLAASGCTTASSGPPAPRALVYGQLVKDPDGVLDLPQGFSYRVVSRLGDAMDDGGTVPDRADGMGCFQLPDGRIALVRNHELKPNHDAGGVLPSGFARGRDGKVLPGGTTTLVLYPDTLEVEHQYRSLAGTIRNCAGGTTPWGSWLTCEEAKLGGDTEPGHGWVFEVPAAHRGLVDPVPLKAMGRFNHEAAVIDPVSGHAYLTEDREDGLIYRFIPNEKGNLAAGGRLQALTGIADTRNWGGNVTMKVGEPIRVGWVDLDDVEAPRDDLRLRGAAKGAALFARGEGIHMGPDSSGRSEAYFCCTSGGAAGYGQVFRLIPGPDGDRLELFYESTDRRDFFYGDNLTVAANGHLVVCEDSYDAVVDNHIRGITPEGAAYPIARLTMQTELAGACFSPDGRTLFVNAYSPSITFAITGPWLA